MHNRKRHILNVLKKRAKFFPVIGLMGPRQVGKTTFLVNEWKKAINASYVTFDKFETATRASQSPDSFLLSETEDLSKKLIIDEAQKVPTIFDSIKALIDEKRRVSAFSLSGSVEFSDKTGIRESLAGRMGLSRLYPLTLAEVSQCRFNDPWVTGLEKVKKPKVKNSHIEKWLTRGGMPIICPIRDDDQRHHVVESWLEALCYKDLNSVKGTRYNGELAIEILRAIAVNSKLNVSMLADHISLGHGAIRKYLSALEALFLIYKLPSFENRRASPDYIIFDSALLRYLLNSKSETPDIRHSSLKTLVINEILAQYEYSGKSKPEIYTYRSRGGATVDFVIKTNKNLIGIDIVVSSHIKPYSTRSIKSFLAKYPDAKGFILAPVTQVYKEDERLMVVPWTYIG